MAPVAWVDVTHAHRPTAEFPQHLESLFRDFPFDRSLAQDPLSCVIPYARDRRAAEVAGLLAATLAVGNTTAIRRAFGDLEARTGGDLNGFVDSRSDTNWAGAVPGFRHRWIRGDQIGYLGLRLKRIYEAHGSLEELFLEGFELGGFAGGLQRLSLELRGPVGGKAPRAPPGYRALFPHPLEQGQSACKRMTLYVRWMVRRERPDLGLWTKVDPSVLRIPLDQHTFWIAYHLGLTSRRTRGWRAVEDVTAALRQVDPVDPVKFDFVLCHTGISGDCPKERDMTVCGPCVVRPDCLLWKGRRSAA
ncbi:MAG: DUF2400 domain-containing protein [Thermoplasmata archaeon]|nr:DUF2400 domain-containing protein [Thermoplasmata archaeon]